MMMKTNTTQSETRVTRSSSKFGDQKLHSKYTAEKESKALDASIHSSGSIYKPTKND
jgi:hypothetical protein